MFSSASANMSTMWRLKKNISSIRNDFSVFHSSSRLVSIFPDSAILIVLGLAAGAILDRFWPHEIYLHPGELDSSFSNFTCNFCLFFAFNDSILHFPVN